MEEFSKLFTDDCLLKMTNGNEAKGAQEVSEVILECCKGYAEWYLKNVRRTIVKGIILGIVITGIGYGTIKILKFKRESKNLKEKEA